jgi:hypothetical protein
MDVISEVGRYDPAIMRALAGKHRVRDRDQTVTLIQREGLPVNVVVFIESFETRHLR